MTNYKHNGKVLNGFPASLDVLGKVESESIEMPGWESDISTCRTFEELPENAKKYILKIEELTGVPVKYIGVGVNRDAMITR